MKDWFGNITCFDSLSLGWGHSPNPGEFFFNRPPLQIDSVNAPVSSENILQTSPEMENIVQTSSEMENIVNQLENIRSYGIGYDDVVALIAVPLIIALFAFSFPFIFNEVNRINDKYDSNNIADLLRSALIYKSYFWINKISLGVLFLYGLLSLIFKDSMRETLLNVGNWILLIVAGIYSFVIFLFVKTCLVFNKPAKVIDFIDNEYKISEKHNKRRYKGSLLIFKICSWRRSEIVKARKFRKIELQNFYIEVNNKYRYIENLKDLAIYSLKARDQAVFFSSVPGGVDRIRELEKDKDTAHSYIFLLLKPIFEFYAGLKQSSEVEDSLVYSLFRFYNKSRLVDQYDIVSAVYCTALLARENCENALSRYIDHSKYGFSFVCRYPKTAYVAGFSGDYLTHRKESAKVWDMICSFHFLAAAYWFANDCYGIFDSMTPAFRRNDPLYPHFGWHILLRFIRCRSKIKNEYKDNVFDIFKSKDIFKEEVNLVKMLDRFTVAFLLVSTADDLMVIDIKAEEIERLRDAKKELMQYVNDIKGNGKLIRVFPHILTADFDRIYDYNLMLLERIREGRFLKSTEPGDKERRPGNWLKRLIGFNTVVPVRYRSVFDEEISSEAISEIKWQLEKFFRNHQEELKRIYNKEIGQGQKMSEVGKVDISLPRTFFLDEIQDRDLYSVSREIGDMIDSRMIYLTLHFLRECKCNNVVTTFENFESCVGKIVNDEPRSYMVIDCESPVKNLMLGERAGKSLVKELDWLKLNDIHYRSLQGLPDYEFFKDRFIIVNKKDMPSMEFQAEKPVINVNEKPYEYGRSCEMILSLDPKLKLAFRNETEITVVRIKKS